MTTLIREVRFALRMLRKSPVFTLVALVTLALGIGANTAIFSVVDGIVLQPLDYANPERIVRLQTSWASEPDADISPAEYFDYRDQLDVFAAIGVYAFSSPSITGDGEPERLRAAFVSSGMLPALGVQPLFGRTFTDEEESPGHDVVILGHDLWQRRFGSSDEVVGQTVVLNGRARTIVGVLPHGFRMPEDYANGELTEVYVPLGIDRTTVQNRGSHFLKGVARLAPNVTVDRAAAQVRALAVRMLERYPDDYPADMQFAATALPLADDVVGPVRPALFVLFCAVGFVLLIACANVANLLIARAEARQSEFALRAALGAGRSRIIRQLIVESVVLATAGGVLGVLLAIVCTELLVALQPPDLPRIDSVAIDFRVLAFTAATTTLTGLLLGAMPAFQATGAQPAAALHEGSGRSTGSRQKLRAGLVVGEIAFALVLLIGAALLARSYAELRSVDPGYRVEQVLTTEVTVPPAIYRGAPEVTGFFRQLLDRVSQLPGVAAAGAVSNLPLATRLGDLNFDIEGREKGQGDVSPAADWQTVTPGYFRAMDIALLHGRGIEYTDDARAPGVVVINETAAQRYWPGEDPVGTRFLLGGGAAPGWVTIVGIVRDVRHAAFDDPPRAQMYLPHEQFRFWDGGGPVRGLTLAIRTVGEPASVAGAVRREVGALDPALPISNFRTMEQVVSASVARPRLMMLLLATFAAVALVLGAVGVYGTMAYLVGRRTREMGIRLALGARPRQVAGLVLCRSLALTASGIGIGVIIAAGLTRSLSGMLYGVAPTDAAMFVAASLILGAVAMFAAWVPIRRATRVDPTVVLRHE
jgi:putative ABC transport system permease protein